MDPDAMSLDVTIVISLGDLYISGIQCMLVPTISPLHCVPDLFLEKSAQFVEINAEGAKLVPVNTYFMTIVGSLYQRTQKFVHGVIVSLTTCQAKS